MAGGQGFKQGMQNASQPRGYESDNYKTQGSHLIGGGAYDRQMQRDGGGYGGGGGSPSSIQSYINVSKSATQGNSDFSIDSANKFTNNTRDQSNVNKQQNAGFSDNRINNNSNFANSQANKASQRNEGFAMNTTNNFVNNAKGHREDNTAKATQFANQTVDKYLAKNKANQTTDVAALDRNIRQAPQYDQAMSQVQGNNTYGDMYSYGRNSLPNYSQPDNPSKIERPDFGGMSDKYMDQMSKFKI